MRHVNLFGKLAFKVGDTVINAASDKGNFNCYYDITKIEILYVSVRYKNAVKSKESEVSGYRLSLKSWNDKYRIVELNKGFYTRSSSEKWEIVGNANDLRGVKVGRNLGIL